MHTDYRNPTRPRTFSLYAAATLLAVLAVGGGWLVWRGLATQPAVASAEAPPQPLPAADTDVAFGAPEMVNGVPWGFPLAADGAAAAAVTAVTVTGQPQAVFDPLRFAEIAVVVFTPDEAELQKRQVDAARTEFELAGWASEPASRRVYYFTPVAVKLVSFDPAGHAVAEVWALTLVGVGDAGGAMFTTSTVELVADGATWKVAGLETREGPTPMVVGTPSAPGRLRALLRDATATLPLPVPEG